MAMFSYASSLSPSSRPDDAQILSGTSLDVPVDLHTYAHIGRAMSPGDRSGHPVRLLSTWRRFYIVVGVDADEYQSWNCVGVVLVFRPYLFVVCGILCETGGPKYTDIEPKDPELVIQR